MSIDPTGFTGGRLGGLISLHYRENNSIPFLGAGISKEHFASGSELAKKVSDAFGYHSKTLLTWPK